MKNCCRDNRCIKCCLETRMPLSNQDVKRIKTLGYSKKFFVTPKNGWLQLKNKDGKCVFHDGSMCIIYNHRPEGCKFYPVIYEKDNGCAILDNYCPYRENFRISKVKAKKLYNLVLKLEFEKVQRRNFK